MHAQDYVDEFQKEVDDKLAEREDMELNTSQEKKERMREEALINNFSKMYNDEGY